MKKNTPVILFITAIILLVIGALSLSSIGAAIGAQITSTITPDGDTVTCTGTALVLDNPLGIGQVNILAPPTCTVSTTCRTSSPFSILSVQRDITLVVNGKNVDSAKIDFGFIGGAQPYELSACVPTGVHTGTITIKDGNTQKAAATAAW